MPPMELNRTPVNRLLINKENRRIAHALVEEYSELALSVRLKQPVELYCSLILNVGTACTG